MRRLICTFVVRIWLKTRFCMTWPKSRSHLHDLVVSGMLNSKHHHLINTYINVFMKNLRKLSFDYHQIPILFISLVKILVIQWGMTTGSSELSLSAHMITTFFTCTSSDANSSVLLHQSVSLVIDVKIRLYCGKNTNIIIMKNIYI